MEEDGGEVEVGGESEPFQRGRNYHVSLIHRYGLCVILKCVCGLGEL